MFPNSGAGLGCGIFCTFAAMNWTVIIIETIVLTLAFTAMILIPLVKNPCGGLRTILSAHRFNRF